MIESHHNYGDSTLKLVWLRQFPPSIISVLTVTEELSMDKVTENADKVYENTKSTEVSVINNTVNDSVTKCLVSHRSSRI